MAQFDVHRNPGRLRKLRPFILELQNRRFSRVSTRLVVALAVPGSRVPEEHYLAPRFIVEGHSVVLDVFSIATIPVSRLGWPVASLADDESRMKIQRALDELLSNA